MDSAKLDELERLAKAATPGPWTEGRHDMKSIVEGYPAKYIYSPFQAVAIACGEDVAWHQVICNAEYIVAACNAVPELIARVRELEGRIAELAKENSGHKRVIHILENKVLELKGKPVPMEPRLPTCDALCRPRYILQSNCSNAAKEAGE